MSLGLVARDDATAEFLDGAARGQFLIRQCAVCGRHSGPQAQQCYHCGSAELSWVPASGAATLVSWRQRGHLPPNASIVCSTAHGPVPLRWSG